MIKIRKIQNEKLLKFRWIKKGTHFSFANLNIWHKVSPGSSDFCCASSLFFSLNLLTEYETNANQNLSASSD
jgi:hypothetical protein